MNTRFLFFGTIFSILILCGCPIFVDTTPPVKKKTEPEFVVKDTLYYFDPNYFYDLDRSRPYQVPSGVPGFSDEWVTAPEFSRSSPLDQIIWRVTRGGWYCVTDSSCRCVRYRTMFPGDIFHLANRDSFLVGTDKVYPGDCPWSISTRIMETDSLQESWRQKQIAKKLVVLKDSMAVVYALIVIKEKQAREEKYFRYAIFGLGLLVLFFSFYYRKELISIIAKRIT